MVLIPNSPWQPWHSCDFSLPAIGSPILVGALLSREESSSFINGFLGVEVGLTPSAYAAVTMNRVIRVRPAEKIFFTINTSFSHVIGDHKQGLFPLNVAVPTYYFQWKKAAI